eukprot:2978399-Prorocentrum_lima.AAC.1
MPSPRPKNGLARRGGPEEDFTAEGGGIVENSTKVLITTNHGNREGRWRKRQSPIMFKTGPEGGSTFPSEGHEKR